MSTEVLKSQFDLLLGYIRAGFGIHYPDRACVYGGPKGWNCKKRVASNYWWMKTEKKERRETKEASSGKVPAQCSCTLWTILLVAGYLYMIDQTRGGSLAVESVANMVFCRSWGLFAENKPLYLTISMGGMALISQHQTRQQLSLSKQNILSWD